MKNYINVPKFTTIQNVFTKDYTLSATQYKNFAIKNSNQLTVADFLERDLKREDLGNEIGSDNYAEDSDYYFIKTKALQDDTFLLDINKESFQSINPNSMIDMNLKKGDILISKDSNVGNVAILDRDYPNATLCGGIYKLPVNRNKYYLLAFIKSSLFREQIDFLVPRGSTIRHGKRKFIECKIPIPNKNKKKTIKYVELLTQAIINKEIKIRERHDKILQLIEKELKDNQKAVKFEYTMPSIGEISKQGRLDTSLYNYDFKYNNFIITNYKYGYINLTDRGYEGIRGTSLENNFIQSRIDSDYYIKGFYELIIPTNISEYGYIKKSSYIGTPTKLKTIHKGDIIFGGEGFGKGRTFVVCENVDNIATNYHGIRIINKNNDLIDSIFIRCFLAYCREKKIIDNIGVGGSGGHCAPSYFHLINTPLFPTEKKEEISRLYYHSNFIYDLTNCSLDNFISTDQKFNEEAGIYNLYKSIMYLKELLNNTIEKIACDEEVCVNFK